MVFTSLSSHYSIPCYSTHFIHSFYMSDAALILMYEYINFQDEPKTVFMFQKNNELKKFMWIYSTCTYWTFSYLYGVEYTHIEKKTLPTHHDPSIQHTIFNNQIIHIIYVDIIICICQSILPTNKKRICLICITFI